MMSEKIEKAAVGGRRSFTRELNEQGTAAQIRSQVAAAFSNTYPDGPGGSGPLAHLTSPVASLISMGSRHPSLFSTPSSTNVTDVVDPIDYEKFLAENAAMLDTDPHRDLLIFPEDDVSVTSLPRKHRTIEIPVPGPAKRSEDLLVRDCVRSFTQDWTVVNRKYGSFHGQDEQFLSRRFSSCKRTSSYTKLLPRHQFEVDMPHEDTISEAEKRLYRASMTSK